jgi:hypothetical protein
MLADGGLRIIMALTYKDEWELRRRKDDLLVARLRYKRGEFPWLIYHFEPTEAFDDVRHLFDEERDLREQVYMNEDDINLWGKKWQAMMKTFKLVAVGETRPAESFMLRIEGDFAYLNV